MTFEFTTEERCRLPAACVASALGAEKDEIRMGTGAGDEGRWLGEGTE